MIEWICGVLIVIGVIGFVGFVITSIQLFRIL